MKAQTVPDARALVAGIHVFLCYEVKMWMAGSSSAKTRFALLPGHDEKVCPFLDGATKSAKSRIVRRLSWSRPSSP